MAYHVFIERSQDPAAVDSVAAAIGERYGLPSATIAQRMAKGRFRVKANCDMRTAARFAADLERLGAVCTIVEEGAAAAQSAPAAAPKAAVPEAASATRPPAIPGRPVRSRAPAQAKATILGAGPAAPPAAPPQPAASDAPAAPAASDAPAAPAASDAASAPEYQSGLSAAFSAAAEPSSPGLGALETPDSGMFSLATLDGNDDAAPAAGDDGAPRTGSPLDDRAFAPPDSEEEDLQLDTAMPEVVRPDGTGDDDVPIDDDAFAPPDSDDDEIQLNTPPPEILRPPTAPRTVAPAPPIDELGALPPELAAAAPAKPAREGIDVKELIREHFLEKPRVRFAAGVFLVILLGFVPARLYFGAKVSSAQEAINEAMVEPITLAKEDNGAWDDLATIGAGQLALGESRLGNARITAILIWLLLSGGLGFVYFKKIDWDRIDL